MGCRNKVDKSKLTAGTRVALDMTTLTIMRMLPREVSRLCCTCNLIGNNLPAPLSCWITAACGCRPRPQQRREDDDQHTMCSCNRHCSTCATTSLRAPVHLVHLLQIQPPHFFIFLGVNSFPIAANYHPVHFEPTN